MLLGKPDLIAKLERQIAWRQQIDAHSKQLFQFDLQTAKVEQGRPRQRIHQQIEVAAVPIGAVQHRTEDARVCGAEPAGRFTHGGTLEGKGAGSHGTTQST